MSRKTITTYLISTIVFLLAAFGISCNGEEAESFVVELLASPSEGGTLAGAGTYDSGHSLTVMAASSEGFAFSRWTEDEVEISTNPVYVFEVSKSTTLVAHFEALPAPTYLLTLGAEPEEGGHAIDDTDAAPYEEGAIVALRAVPNGGFGFVAWVLDGAQVSTDANFDYTMPASDTVLTAVFEALGPPRYTLTLMAAPSAGGTVTDETNGSPYEEGTMVSLAAVPNDGYIFSGWVLDESVISAEMEFVFPMPSEDTLVEGSFSLKTYEIQVVLEPEEGGSVEGAGVYQHGDEVLLIAERNPDYRFLGWREGEIVLGAESRLEFIALGDRVIRAVFEEIVPETVTLFGNRKAEGRFILSDAVYVYTGETTNALMIGDDEWGSHERAVLAFDMKEEGGAGDSVLPDGAIIWEARIILTYAFIRGDPDDIGPMLIGHLNHPDWEELNAAAFDLESDPIGVLMEQSPGMQTTVEYDVSDSFTTDYSEGRALSKFLIQRVDEQGNHTNGDDVMDADGFYSSQAGNSINFVPRMEVKYSLE